MAARRAGRPAARLPAGADADHHGLRGRARLGGALRAHRREPGALGAGLPHRQPGRRGARPRRGHLRAVRADAEPGGVPHLPGAEDRHAADLHALVRHRRPVEDPDHRARLLLPDVHQCLLRGEVDAADPRLVGAEHGRRRLAPVPQGRGARGVADDLRRPAGVARALLHRDVRHRDDQRALGPRLPDPRRRKRPALRPDVRVAAEHRHPGLCQRRPAAAGAAARPRLAGAAGMRRLAPFVLVGIALLAWESAARSGLWSPLLFPSLERIGRELFAFLLRSDSLMEAGISLGRALGGFAAAAFLGVLLGMLMGRSVFVAGMLEPLFSGTYAVPKLALFPVFILVFGIGSLSKVALIFLECLYPIVIMTSQGARNVNRVLLWSAQNMGASRAQILRRIVIPATAPFIFAGFRVSLPVAMIVVV